MIQFVNDISPARLRMAYNNDVVRFYTTLDNAQWADVTINPGPVVRLYPNPQGQFYFNFKPYITALINTHNFEDTVVTGIDSADAATFVYNMGNSVFTQRNVTFSITLPGGGTEQAGYVLSWLAGVQQLGSYIERSVTGFFLLMPPKAGTTNNFYAKYWQGYPFDIAYYTPAATVLIHNNTNQMEQGFTGLGYGDRLFFSDGRTDETLEDILPLADGYNELVLTTGEHGSQNYLVLYKEPYKNGVYLKWLNSYGGYSYWLFEDTYSVDRATKDLGELDRDLDNLQDSFGRTSQIGRQTQDTLKIVAELLTEDERAIAEGILDSPKVYLFTGRPYARNGYRDWIEVNLKTSSARIKNPREALINFAFDIELPIRYAQTL